MEIDSMVEMNTICKLAAKDCTGCAACMNCCHTGCISMQRDEEGFLHPVIDHSKCTNCSTCTIACPVLTPPRLLQNDTPTCYAAWSKNPEIRFESTSGGVFTHLAKTILNQGGCVVGARYREDCLVEHTMISSDTELGALRQSKYVQSEIGLVYQDIRSQLNKKTPVLFMGTPCQCAGLRSFLKINFKNLYLCDFICRGVNSPTVYLSYLHDLEKKYLSRVRRVWFKNKTFGWNNFCTKIVFENGEEYLADRETDPFMLGYIKSQLNLYIRPSCYDCKFKGMNRHTDITLGDFWGVEKLISGIDCTNGVSLVILHSDKGKRLFQDSSSELLCYAVEVSQALRQNVCAVQSVEQTGDRKRFFAELNQKGFFASINKFLSSR